MDLDEYFDYKATGTFYAVIIPKQHTLNNQEVEAGSFDKKLALEILKQQKSDFWYGKIGDIFVVLLLSIIFLPLGIALFMYWYFKGTFKPPYLNVKNNTTRPIYEHELADARRLGLAIEKISYDKTILEDELQNNTKSTIKPINNENFNSIIIQPSSLEKFTEEFNDWYKYLKNKNIIETIVSNEFVTFQDMMYKTSNDGMITYLYTQAFEKGYFLAEYIIHYNKYITKSSIDKICGEVFESAINEILIFEDKGIGMLFFLDNSFHQFVQDDNGSYGRVIEETQRGEIWEFSKKEMLVGIITRFTEFKFSLSINKVELNGIKIFQRKYPNFKLERILTYISTTDYEALNQKYKEQIKIEEAQQQQKYEDLKVLRDYLKEENLTLEELMQQLNEIQDIQNKDK